MFVNAGVRIRVRLRHSCTTYIKVKNCFRDNNITRQQQYYKTASILPPCTSLLQQEQIWGLATITLLHRLLHSHSRNLSTRFGVVLHGASHMRNARMDKSCDIRIEQTITTTVSRRAWSNIKMVALLNSRKGYNDTTITISSS